MPALDTPNDVFAAFQLGIINIGEARIALSLPELPTAQPVSEGDQS